MTKPMAGTALLAGLLLVTPAVAAQNVLVVYHSQSGHTEQLARAVADGAAAVEGAEVRVRTVDEVVPDELAWADALVVGSPVHNANVSAPVVAFLNGLPFDGTMQDKVGAAFATGGGISAGEESVQLAILRSMLVFRMIVVGGPDWTSAFGASAITEEGPFGEPGADVDEIFLAKGAALGRRVAEVARRLGSG